jgi:hypothetical protein
MFVYVYGPVKVALHLSRYFVAGFEPRLLDEEIPLVLQKPKMHCSVHKSLLLDRIKNHMNPYVN